MFLSDTRLLTENIDGELLRKLSMENYQRKVSNVELWKISNVQKIMNGKLLKTNY